MGRIRTFFRRISSTLHYWRRWRAAPPSARFVPARSFLKAPICWWRGHSWERFGGSFSIESWTAQFCTCCGQEVGFRVSLDQLRSPETDEELEYAEQDRERWYDDEYLDADGAFADWDAMRDHAATNGVNA